VDPIFNVSGDIIVSIEFVSIPLGKVFVVDDVVEVTL
jgi:hypothetical protein